jgi:hypothetical protein
VNEMRGYLDGYGSNNKKLGVVVNHVAQDSQFWCLDKSNCFNTR